MKNTILKIRKGLEHPLFAILIFIGFAIGLSVGMFDDLLLHVSKMESSVVGCFVGVLFLICFGISALANSYFNNTL